MTDTKNDNKLTENTILNLKMMSQIKPFDKLYLDDGLIKIDTPYFEYIDGIGIILIYIYRRFRFNSRTGY